MDFESKFSQAEQAIRVAEEYRWSEAGPALASLATARAVMAVAVELHRLVELERCDLPLGDLRRNV